MRLELLLSKVFAISVAVVLFASAIKVRFGLSDLYTLYLPFFMLLVSCALAISLKKYVPLLQLLLASAYLILLLPSAYSFGMGGGDATDLMSRVLINITLGLAIALYPARRDALDFLFLVIVVLGCVLSVDTLLTHRSFAGTNVSVGYTAALKANYLDVTFVTAVAAIAALYRLIERLTLLNLLFFFLCWVGVAMSLGRGALLFGAVVTILYLLCAFFSRITSLSARKKIVLAWAFAVAAPVVFISAMSIERTAQRLRSLFSDTDAQSGVAGRMTVYRAALDKIGENPIFGGGMGHYQSYWGHPHNIFLQYWVDSGLLGLMFVLLFFLIVAYSILRGFVDSTPASRNLILVSAALFGFMFLSYMKSHDAYLGREMFMLSAIPLLTLASLSTFSSEGRSSSRVGNYMTR